MAQEIVEVPNFKFGMYYADILDSLLEFARVNVPELSDESEFEPWIQLMRAVALATHEHNVLLDVVAQESVLSTSRLQESVREHLKAQGYKLRSAQPGTATIVAELANVLNSSRVIVPEGSILSTDRNPVTNESAFFEADADVSSTPTDVFTSVLSSEDALWTDFTTQCNTASSPATDWTPWGSPAVADALYFGHDSVMWDRLDIFAATETVPGSGFGVWEYYTGDTVRAKPDSVVSVASRLRFVVDSYVGSENRQGTVISVRLNSTFDSEEAVVVWTGANNIIETGLVGQSVPSTDINDYSIGSNWEELGGLTTTTGVGDLYLGIDDEAITWELPQTQTQNWTKTTIEGVEAYWVRFRWVEVPTSGPVMRYVRMTEGKQYIKAEVTQGRTFVDSPLGSSDGTPNQRLEGIKSNFIDSGTDELLVDNAIWTRVDDFISSSSTDQHYVVELSGDDNTGVVVFGDGVNGAVPAVGASNIIWTYRYGANVDGNVGANSIVKDRSSLVSVNRIWNPRQGLGWSSAEGETEASLQRAKQLAARLAQTKDVAMSADDLPPLTVRYQTDEGSSPFSRAFSVEELYGPKTVGLVVMASGGGEATQEQLDELSLFFNGDKMLGLPSRFTANQQVIAINHEQNSIDINAVVYARGVTRQEIENQLTTLFQPDAQDDDGNWTWEFEDLISTSRIKHEIHDVSDKISDVDLISPTQNIQLDSMELPIIGTLNITVIDPSKQ